MILFRAIHADYLSTWQSWEKSTSYKKGARWNQAGTPVQYFSSNVQNAMLELGNYTAKPQVANSLYVMGVFDCPSLRLKELQPADLPQGWEIHPFHEDTQEYGTRILQNDDYDGLIVPSCAINTSLATSPHNEVRKAIYANIVLNPTRSAVEGMSLLDTYQPIYSNRMFQ